MLICSTNPVWSLIDTRSPIRTGCVKATRTPAEVPERRAEREPGHDREHRARREERPRDLLGLREDRQHAPGADRRDDHEREAAQEAERRPASRHHEWIGVRLPSLPRRVRPADEVADEHEHAEPDRARDERTHPQLVHPHRIRRGNRCACQSKRGRGPGSLRPRSGRLQGCARRGRGSEPPGSAPADSGWRTRIRASVPPRARARAGRRRGARGRPRGSGRARSCRRS